MCFGEKLDEKVISEIETVLRSLLLYLRKLNILQFFPVVTKYVYRNRWRMAIDMAWDGNATIRVLCGKFGEGVRVDRSQGRRGWSVREA
ncbi:cytochrome P450 89A2-like isoform X1 [Iris pallida]|uniref:Cytochrome P450 89A2-like isoform X1 n=1 Tax=Iris pallida TaxID=29817 RepID=A0AAX6E444_IRIPA|nr:cytochrome P450 89A2-like isoform X1 [Iris pallida]